MSIEYSTPLGNFRKVVVYERADGAQGSGWLIECPVCKGWGGLSMRQLHGQVSVWCTPQGPCTYHETHDYAKALKEAGADV